MIGHRGVGHHNFGRKNIGHHNVSHHMNGLNKANAVMVNTRQRNPAAGVRMRHGPDGDELDHTSFYNRATWPNVSEGGGLSKIT